MAITEYNPVREAKDFLAGKIIAEAESENVPISEVERKMLYFSETGWTLPDMAEVNECFDRDYDQDEYEAKIAGLVQAYLAHAGAESKEELKDWEEAVEKLSEGDHYLLVMMRTAPSQGNRLRDWFPDFSSSYSGVRRKPRPGDRLRLWIFAFVLVFGCLALRLLWDWIGRSFVL